MQSLRRLAGSSVGKKSIMAVTGLLLFGFLISHVGGNALLLARDNGESYNAYAAKLRSFGPLLWVARSVLAALFLAHVFLALRLSAQNRRARGERGRTSLRSGGRAISSCSMLLTGMAILLFLAIHLWHFSLDRRFASDGAALVKATLKRGPFVGLYTVGILCLWVHLWHALPSAIQSLGLASQRKTSPSFMTLRAAVSAMGGLFLVILWSVFLNG